MTQLHSDAKQKEDYYVLDENSSNALVQQNYCNFWEYGAQLDPRHIAQNAKVSMRICFREILILKVR